MGKSILVMDTPVCCMECPMCFHADDISIGNLEYRRLYSCRFAPSDAEDFYLPDILSKKPDWCPLQDVPEKKDKNPYHNEHESGYVDGWNACIDKIMNAN